MVNGILGKKIGMTQMFDEKGEVHPITVLQAGPCVVTQTSGHERRIRVGADRPGRVREGKNVTKADAGPFGKHNLPPVKFMREVAWKAHRKQQPRRNRESGEGNANGNGAAKVGDKVLVDIFNDEGYVDVVGVSKGRGFAGVVKRHKFGGGPGAHGHMFQVQGSIGASSFPSRVFPGMRMSGHMGVDQVTVRNLRILGIDTDDNLLMVEGAVPGHREWIRGDPRKRRSHRESAADSPDSTTLDPLKAAKKAAAGKKK